MKRGWGSSLAGLCGGVLFGSMVIGCGPVPEDGTPGEVEVVGNESPVLETQASRMDLDDYVPAPLARYGPAVAYGGGKYLVVWYDVRVGGVYGTRVRTDGSILDPEGLRLNTGSESGGPPAVAYNGKHFFVVWDDGDGVSGVRVRTDGSLAGAPFKVITSGETFGPVGIACSEKLCLVTFMASGDAEEVVYFRRVSKDGIVLDPFVSSVSPGENFAGEASVAWNNSKKQFLIVWSDQRGGAGTEDIYGNRVKEDGTILDGDGFPISQAGGAQRSPDVTWSGRRFHVVWSDTRDGDADIYGARVRPNGTVEDISGLGISVAPGEQTTPRVAHHNSKSLVVWADTRGGSNRIWGARLSEDGDVWDPAGCPLSVGALDEEYMPDVAYGDDRFFTAYAVGEDTDPREPHYILGTRVNHQGEMKDLPFLPLTLEPL